jgi:predicted nucleic-acid-binding protein
VIGLDTDTLLRLWLNDDAAQNRRIDKLLAEYGDSPGALMVSDVVLAEAVWTLRAAYRQNKAAQSLAVRGLLEEAAFAFENRDAVCLALALFEGGNRGFSDCLIAARNARLGCDFTATFDRRMRELPGAQVL